MGTFPPSEINMPDLIEALETIFKTTMDHRGRIYIPKQVRRILQITEGERVYIKIEKDHFEVYTTEALKSHAKGKN